MLKTIDYGSLMVSNSNDNPIFHDCIFFYHLGLYYGYKRDLYNITECKIYNYSVSREVVDYLLEKSFEIKNLDEIFIY